MGVEGGSFTSMRSFHESMGSIRESVARPREKVATDQIFVIYFFPLQITISFSKIKGTFLGVHKRHFFS